MDKQVIVFNMADSSIFTIDSMRVPKVSIHPQSIQVQPGSPASFSCNVGSTEEVTYRWHKKDGIMSAQATVDEENRELTFNAVTVKDSGVYVCSAENTYGSDREEAVLQVLSGRSSHPISEQGRI